MSEQNTEATPSQSNGNAPLDFRQAFEQTFGINADEFKAAITQFGDMQTFVSEMKQQREAETTYNNQLQELQTTWGVDKSELDTRINKINQYVANLPEDQVSQYDSVDGVKTLWAKIESETNNQTPKFFVNRGNNTTAPQQQYKFTKSELLAMDDATYEKNADAVLEAYRLGLVDQSQ